MPPPPTAEIHGPFLVRSPSGEVRIGTLAELVSAMTTAFRGQPVEIFELSTGRYIAASAVLAAGTSAVRRSTEVPASRPPTPLAGPGVPPTSAVPAGTVPVSAPVRPVASGARSESSSGWPVVAPPAADSWSVPSAVLPSVRPTDSGRSAGAARPVNTLGQDRPQTTSRAVRQLTNVGSDRVESGAAHAGAPTERSAGPETFRRAGMGPSDSQSPTTTRARRPASDSSGPSIVVGPAARPSGTTARLTASSGAPARPSVSGRATPTTPRPGSRQRPAWVRDLEPERRSGDGDAEDDATPRASRAVRVSTVLGILLAVAGVALFWARQSGMFAPDMIATAGPPRSVGPTPTPVAADGAAIASGAPAKPEPSLRPAVPPPTPRAQGLQMWLPFNTGGQPGEDAAGQRIVTQVEGMVQVVDDPQRHGVATFDGRSSIAVANPVHGAFTLACWLRTTQDLIPPSGDAEHAGWWDGIGLIDGEVPKVVSDFGMSLIEGRCAFGTGAPDGTLLSSGRVNDGIWHHVAGVRDARGTITLYIDGRRDGSRGGAPEPRDATQRLTIGCIQTGTNHFIGKLDEVRIYDRAMDDAEIASLVAAERVVKP